MTPVGGGRNIFSYGDIMGHQRAALRYAPSADIWPLGDTSATLRIPRELRHLSIGIGAVLSTRRKFTKN